MPYHNAIHAADVVHGCHFLLASCGADTLLRRGQSAGDALSADLLSFSLILSAAVHDLQHDGYNNRYHTLVKSARAQCCETSVQEEHHLRLAFSLLGEEVLDLTVGWPAARRAQLDKLLRAQVLATDMKYHFDLIAEFQAAVDESRGDPDFWYREEARGLLCRLLLHAADISNPAREMGPKITWASLVYQEFFNQGDEERVLGVELSPNCDITAVKLPESQYGFVKAIVRPTFELIAEVLPLAAGELMRNLDATLEYYGSMEGDGDLPDELRFKKVEGPGKFLYRPKSVGLAKPRGGGALG